MKRNTILLFLLPALLIAGCENPMDDHGPDAGSPTTFTATIEGGDGTKTTLGTPDASGVRAVKWSGDDAISISGATYTVSSGAGTTSATFTGSGATLSEGKYKAYYPAKIYHGGTPTLPATQTYVAGRIDNLPMYAEAVSPSTDLNFKNLCAVLEFKLTGSETVGSIGLKSTEGKKLSGAFTPQNWASDSRSVVMSESASDTVTLYCGTSGVALNATTPKSFFVAVPAQSYTSGTLRVTVKDLSGNEITSFTNSVSDSQLKRSEIYDIGKSTKTGVFSVTYNGTTTSSTGTNVEVDLSTSSIPFSASTLSFAVTTNLGGYTVEVLDADMNVNTTIAPVLPSADASGDNLSAPVVVSNNLNLSSFTDPGLTVFEPFSVSATQKVYFSPGNLQYQASADGVTASDNWRFAPHQWEWVGDDNHGNVYTSSTAKSTNTVEPESAREFYTGWIDLFGWGATGQRYSTNTSHRYQPWAYSGTNYGPGNENLSGKSDWGYNMGEGYRTLTGGPNGEWDYLVNKRVTEGMMSYMITKLLFSSSARIFYIRFKAKNDSEYSVTYKFQQEPGADTYGVILFPDDFATNHAAEAALYTGYFNDRYSRRELSLTEWLSLQSAGCVFLPQTANRNNNQSAAVTSINYACYWTQSFSGSNNYSYSFYFTNLDGASVRIHVDGSGYRYRGNAVRLVKDVTP